MSHTHNRLSELSRPFVSHAFHAIALGVAVVAAGTAFAQSAPSLQPLPDVPPPPRLSATPPPADDESQPQITVRVGEGGAKVEEYRTRNGRLYAVRVTPSIGKPYLLVDPDGRGVMSSLTEIPAGEIDGGVRPAQWTIFEW